MINKETAKTAIRTVADLYGCTMLSVDEICEIIEAVPEEEHGTE